MTVSSEVSSVSYNGNGSTQIFAVPFYFLADSHLRVILRAADGTETVQTITTNYTVAGAGNQAGGTVTMLSAPASGTVLAIVRNVPATQETDYVANDPFPAESHERALDKLTMLVQQGEFDNSRALRVPDSDPAPLPLPPAQQRANKLLSFDANGDPVSVAAAAQSATDLEIRLADPFSDSNGDALIAVRQAGSTLGRTQHQKNSDVYYLADFPGIDFTGATDSTAGVQAAIDYCAANKIELHLGKGTVLVTQLTGRSDLILRGPGMGAFTFKRNPSAATGYPLSFNNCLDFQIYDFTIDGNKAAAVNGGNNLIISGSSAGYVVSGIESKNAKSSSGFGDGIYASGETSGSSAGGAKIVGCRVVGNNGAGIVVARVSTLTITDNFVYLNGGAGIDVSNFVFPPVSDVANDLEISRNRCLNNLIGIRGLGYYRGGSAGAPIYGIEIPPSRHVNIRGNHCSFNTEYGIAWQAANAIIAENHISRNGNSTSNGGALLNGWRCQFTNNSLEDNYFYGIDAGGSINCIISGNHFVRTGATSGAGSTDINLGAAQNCTCAENHIEQTGVSGACVAIGAPRWDGDGTKFFPTRTQNLNIIGNVVEMNGFASSLGFYFQQGPANLILHNNRVRNAAAGKDFVIEANGVVQTGNFSGIWPGSTGVPAAGVTAASTTVIPDIADVVFVGGSTTITRLHTASFDVFYQKVFKVDITNAGSGYTSAPSVSFSGGGGSGVAGTALLGSDGTIIGVQITNPGSGYTSAPSVSFSGGGGSGVAATATVGCDNFAARRVTLLLQNSVTITDGGNLALAGNMVATGGSTLTLVGYNGAWQEVSRAVV